MVSVIVKLCWHGVKSEGSISGNKCGKNSNHFLKKDDEGNHVLDSSVQFIATSHDLGPQKVTEEGKSSYGKVKVKMKGR